MSWEIGTGLVIASVFSAIGVLAVVSLYRSQQRRRNREICPKCLAVGTLRIEAAGSSDVRCVNVVQSQPHEECDFTFPAYYLDHPKLALTGLGIPYAGKSHWMAMLYSQIGRGDYLSEIELTPLRNARRRQMDDYVDQILRQRETIAATMIERLPDPLVFELRDRKRRHSLINLFDFAGEVTVRDDFNSSLRRRQLDAEGYLFFLDPTQPHEIQASALTNFCTSSRLYRKIPPQARINAPLAICLTKLDLMMQQTYYDPGGAIDHFYDELRAIDPSGRDMSAATIQARSHLTASLLPMIWPGWSPLRLAQSFFGSRFMIFPMTPVGLNDLATAPSMDLSDRIIEPYAICGPVLWLLEQNGYSVIK
jgi:hypothetical protein